MQLSILRVLLPALLLLSSCPELTLAASPIDSASESVHSTLVPQSASAPDAIAEEARHRLVTLPYYGVFDWLEGQVMPDGTLVLRGQVVKPTTKSDAESRVKSIPGVSRVENQIEVLPLSPNDDRLRRALYRAIYSLNSPLFKYATMAVPPIHLIVANGRATLKGVVDTKADADLAYIKARGVPGLFGVTNQLVVAQPGREAR
jgi:hyperosmotically inducible periplasmic protein